MSKISVTPLGSCRVTNPLRSGLARRRLHLNMNRVYGYTHSSAEAVQLARFLQGDFHPPVNVSSVLFPSRSAQDILSARHEPSDLYIVELSSSKLIEVEGAYIQNNYLKQHFREFFSDSNRARRFWRLAKEGQQGELLAFLAGDPTFAEYSIEDQKLLSRVRFSQSTEASLREDMLEIVERLGRVVFVPHCDASGPDGQALKPRSTFIKLVNQVAREIGASIYNPSVLKEKLGQEKTFKDDGTNLTHYTSDFEEQIILEWDEMFIRPVKLDLGLDPHVDDESEELIEFKSKISRAASLSQDMEVSSLLQAALEKFPDDMELLKLQFGADVTAGDYTSAFESFHVLDLLGQIVDEDIIVMIQLAHDNGNWIDVVDFNERLILAACNSMESMELAAAAAENLNSYAQAIDCWIAVFEESYQNTEAARRVAVNAHLGERREIAIEWCRTALELEPVDADTLVILAENLLSYGESVELQDALITLTHALPSIAVDLIERSHQAGIAVSAAYAIAAYVGMKNCEATLVERCMIVCGEWLEAAHKLCEQDNQIDAMRYQRAVLIVSPKNAEALRMTKVYWMALRKQLREAFLAKEYHRAVLLGEGCKFVQAELKESLPLVGRAAFFMGDYVLAISWLRRSVSVDPEDLVSWLFLARSAMKVEDYTRAATAYEMIFQKTPVDQKGGQESVDNAGQQIQRIVVLVVSKARILMAEDDLQAAWQLTQLALRLDPGHEKTTKTAEAIVRATRKKLLSFDGEEAATIVAAADAFLEMDPGSIVGMKIKALELTRMGEYALALPVWKQYAELVQDSKSALFQINKCERMLP
jgi:tetratricopeptide (TPR) repeat protein